MSISRNVTLGGHNVIKLTVCDDGAVKMEWADIGSELNLTLDEFEAVYAAFDEIRFEMQL